MDYGTRSQSSIFDTFTLSPLPYPVLLLLLVVFLLLGVSWSFTYESIMESTEEQLSWVLLATPVILLLLIRWLSSFESTDVGLLGFYDRRQRWSYYGSGAPQEGSSPWGVAAVVVLLLVLVSYQSTFQDMWRP